MRIISRGVLAARLKAARLKAGHTQASLAKELSVKQSVRQSAISAWEKGDYEPERSRWEDIATALKVSLVDLFFDTAEEPEVTEDQAS